MGEAYLAHMSMHMRNDRIFFKAAIMTQQNKDQQHSPKQAHPNPSQDANEQKKKAEQNEVAGRHKNDGQKDHKGAR